MNEPYPLLPYQYELIFAIMRAPLAACELANDYSHRFGLEHSGNPTLSMSNRLRPLVRRGWLTVEDNIYRATPEAYEAVSW